jgi:hypothetical protein
MEAKDDGRKIERHEAVQEVARWMIVARDERVRDPDAMVPGLMPICKSAAIRRVQDVQVDVVLEDLRNCQNDRKKRILRNLHSASQPRVWYA